MIRNVFLGLGSNLGDRLENLRKASLSIEAEMVVQQYSSIYETAPWGYHDQPEFLNQVLKCATKLKPLELLSFLKRIEQEMGRETSFLYGPRLIDIDILFYNQLVINYPRLSIPHPQIEKRAFVLVPLMEIAPDFCHPATGRTVQEMYQEVDKQGIKKVKVNNSLLEE
ncbi:MAG: 2-amino-4-hydroxy-6-hydroxymethyldihydropteridine diphosphokinase [Anaerolineales bacterium]